MGNTAFQSSTAASSTLKSRGSFETESLTVGDNSSSNPSETNHNSSEDKKPMKLIGKNDTHSGSTKSKMPQSKTATTMSSPKISTSAKRENDVDRRDDSVPRSSKIRDDQVQVNLAMADLMAYLQVVANNSNNLPLTRRDDPELTRMVSTLTNEEYARKSAAFFPADVRVISGSFLKYGKVWDLPTSEEYTALDGAQEPGRSYGGACCNSMLKVLYDAANEATDGSNDHKLDDRLFNDDDDESLATVPFARNDTYASLDMTGQSNPSTITWADLLRKMKTEISEIEYPQVPSINASRKFDLNQPFSLVPDNFDKSTGKKRSLLIGCNYRDTDGAELKASHDDIRSMKDYIVNVHGFPETDDTMTILLDDDEHQAPTFMNIVEAFKSLSEQSQPGDAVFIQFAGHGGRILDTPIDPEVESYDEMIAPCDYTTSGLIRDTLIFKTLLAPMRYGVTVTVLIDCCDTGMMLDLPYCWCTRADKPDAVAKMVQSEDFSFVRFLKVVKTLYESSTFTQLGRTVGSALGQQPVGNGSFDDDGTAGETTHTRQEIERSLTDEVRASGEKSSLFPSLCLSTIRPDMKQGKNAEQDALSLLEKVFGCHFLVPEGEDEMSDEETYGDNTFDDDNTMQNSTFDSVSEGEYNNKRRGKPRRHRRGK
ncbi:caspase domain containing protein [Nitzschia inconspicua]|uniref:Caspase domain containing protein n=1 Tax=Nitzschia inconspicua TaxID=303405 RepID=A0A9K3PQH3_9STRA|nr:caspase domain containing protein [Nitzschia inconspicua]